jgi:DNA invertase Pin-like site-specific DNA recombinase
MVELTRVYSTGHLCSKPLTELQERARSSRRPETRPPRRQHQRQLTAAEKKQVVAMYQAGGTIRGLSREFAVCRQTVRRILVEAKQRPR